MVTGCRNSILLVGISLVLTGRCWTFPESTLLGEEEKGLMLLEARVHDLTAAMLTTNKELQRADGVARELNYNLDDHFGEYCEMLC